jgi:hypothetical protein
MTINLGPIRRIAQAITMGDTIEWVRPGNPLDGTWDDDEGTHDPVEPTPVYSGLASIYSARGVELTETRGGKEVYLVRYWIAVPVDADVVGKAEDVITVTAVDEINGDPTLVGEEFIVKTVEFGTLTATKRASTYRLSDVP